jgi:methyl-accepting chemotaxis protein
MAGGNARAEKLHALLSNMSETIAKSYQGQRTIDTDTVEQERAILGAKGQIDATMLSRDKLYNAMTDEEREKYKAELPANMGKLGEKLVAVAALMPPGELSTKAAEAIAAQQEWKEFAKGFAAGAVERHGMQAPLMVHIEETVGIAYKILENISKSIDDQGTNQMSTIDKSQVVGYIVAGLSVLFGIVVCISITRDITTIITHMIGALNAIANEGIVTIEVPQADLDRGDEMGGAAHAVANILKQLQNVEHLAKELADGNYDVITHVRGDQDTMNIYLNKMLEQVNNAMREIHEGVGQVATSSGEVSNAATNLSSGAQEAAASLEQITASMSEISSQTKTNAESAGQARDLANKASHAAAEGQGAMKEMTTAMERITHNSGEIQRVIKVIDDIAFQTNLLALNAAVEAARAGQHGKGFAVVAEEVRNLASRSAKAARETSELIEKSGQEIEKGGEVAAHTASVLDTIVEQIKQTTDLVAGIAVASNEQAQGVSQVSIGLQQIDSVTQQNTAASEESASAANEMSAMAVNLQKLVAQFKLRA